jgi:cytochrome b561
MKVVVMKVLTCAVVLIPTYFFAVKIIVEADLINFFNQAAKLNLNLVSLTTSFGLLAIVFLVIRFCIWIIGSSKQEENINISEK